MSIIVEEADAKEHHRYRDFATEQIVGRIHGILIEGSIMGQVAHSIRVRR